jgi:hypothetical protein
MTSLDNIIDPSDFLDQILAQKDKSEKTYVNDYNRMVSDYNREKKITGDYKGREILELIQNADDAESNTFYVELNEQVSKLIIANIGIPFSVDGIRSLMISDLSPKTKRTFIGNKGLGFRAILNWSKNVKIYCNQCVIHFSKDIVSKKYYELFDGNTREKILTERKFSKNVIPIPVLAIPEIDISDIKNNTWITIIEIELYKNLIPEINRQIDELKDEILLFLNHIEKIVIKNTVEREIVRKPISANQFQIGEKKWNIFSDEQKLPQKYQDKDKREKEYYNIKIALQEDLTDKVNTLFNYLPTKVTLDFPAVIHGTFELESSRNHLTESEKNKFVLEKLIEKLISTAKELTKKDVNWKPFRLLSYKNINDELQKLKFYETLNSKKEQLAIYPCLDNHYRSKSKAFYYNNEFSDFIANLGKTKLFPDMLKTVPLELNISAKLVNRYDDALFSEKIDALSKSIKDIDHRIKLIHILSKDKIFQSADFKYSLLLNSRSSLIDKNNEIYTPRSKDEDKLSLPDFVKLDFLNRNLYEKLIIELGLSSSKYKSRDLADRLKSISNIQSYEPVPVIRKIVSATKNEIKKDNKFRNNHVKAMLLSLLDIHLSNPETKFPDDLKIQVINKRNTLSSISDCYLSKEFPSGTLTDDLFSKVYKSTEFIADPNKLGFDGKDKYTVENFLLWLGINKHTKFEFIENPSSYEDFVFQMVTQPYQFYESDTNVKDITDFNSLIKSLTKEQIVCWIIKDNSIREQFANNNNTDSFRWRKKGEQYYHYTLNEKPSYILYQFSKQNLFYDYIIEDYKISFINHFDFNFNDSLFSKYGIQKREIESILISLGAVEDFNEISIDRVFDLISNLPTNDHNGDNSQKLYKLAIEHYKKNQIALPPSSYKLYAKTNNIGSYELNSNVYYSDNSTLPKKIINEKPILNMPPRSGEDQISGFFGLKTFSSIKIQICKPYEINNFLTQDFNSHLSKIKPYLLAYRLNKINGQKQREREARSLRKLNVTLYENSMYIVEGNKSALEPNDFINDTAGFHIVVNNYKNFIDLKLDSLFCDAFVEMICISLNINENSFEFRGAFRNDLKETEHSIIKNFGAGLLNDAKQLLGLNDAEKRFWQIIFKLKNKDFAKISSAEMFEQNIADAFKIALPVDISKINYNDLSEKFNGVLFLKLFKILRISLSSFNNLSEHKIDLSEYHRDNLKSEILNYEKTFKSLLWHYLSDKKKEQATFLEKGFSYSKDFSAYTEVFLQKYRSEFECPYLSIIKEYIKNKFSVSTKSAIEIIDFTSIMYKNIKAIDYSIDELPTSLKSLLCFPGNNEIVLRQLKKAEKVIDPPEPPENKEKTKIEVSKSKLKKPPVKTKPKKKSIGGGGTWSPQQDANNREKAKNAENKTYNHLVEIYGNDNVDWVSGFSCRPDADDSLGYDIKYKNEHGIWKYIEVKAASSNYFFLSINEKDFGIANNKDFELAIVKENKIHFINDFFIFDNDTDTFENNSKYEVSEKDYVVFFEIDE